LRISNRRKLPLHVLAIVGIFTSCAASARANEIPSPAQPSAIRASFSVTHQGQQNAAPPASSPDNSTVACTLLSNSAIKSVQGEPLKQTKGSQTQNSSMITSQCFYTLATFTNSISLTVNLPVPGNPPKTGPRDLWKKWFHADASGTKESNSELDSPQPKEEGAEKESAPPVAVPGLGDEAFWVRRFVGTLYVLKGDTILRISIGGKQDDATRQRKAQLLAKSALEKLP
jgi:hypothetical protein